MNDNLDLDERLSELFSQPNLSLTPRLDATSSVLSRVRTARRRRRTLQVAVPAVLAVLIGVGTLSDVGSRLHAAPVPPAATTAPVNADGELVMSGKSVGTIQLGMSGPQVEATGLVTKPGWTPDPAHPECRAYQGRTGLGHQGIVQVAVGPNGAERIDVYTFVRTPENAGIGDTYAHLHSQFPNTVPVTPGPQTDYEVPVRGHAELRYVFHFEAQDDKSPLPESSRVIGLALVTAHRSCP